MPAERPFNCNNCHYGGMSLLGLLTLMLLLLLCMNYCPICVQTNTLQLPSLCENHVFYFFFYFQLSKIGISLITTQID